MESALVVSYSKKSTDFFTHMLQTVSCHQVDSVPSGTAARQCIGERSFDVVIINAPLPDEPGEALARYIASQGIHQVILVVQKDSYEEVSEKLEDEGIITLPKPLNTNLFKMALKLAKASQNKLKRMQDQNVKLIQKIEDIHMIDRAKCILISYLNMTEQEAHKHIERQAMDMRMTKKAVAEGILKTYEN